MPTKRRVFLLQKIEKLNNNRKKETSALTSQAKQNQQTLTNDYQYMGIFEQSIISNVFYSL